MNSQIFLNKKPNFSKLINFGFKKNDNKYLYNTNLLDGQFCLTVTVSVAGDVATKLLDNTTGEIYTLHLLDSASGAFVGQVKEEYETILHEIRDACFEIDVFKSEYTKQVIEFARRQYGDELEFLWEKFTDNAVLRRKDTSKWYAAILTVSKAKLGFESNEKVEVIDLRMPPEELTKIVDNKKYFAAYHMNKKHWLTIILDGSVPIEEVFQRMQVSYSLADK